MEHRYRLAKCFAKSSIPKGRFLKRLELSFALGDDAELGESLAASHRLKIVE